MAVPVTLAPGTVADGGEAAAPMVWNNPNNAKVFGDATSAQTDLMTNQTANTLKATNFGFTIPSGATIIGILVNIGKYKADNAGTSIADNIVKIIKSDGSLGATNKAVAGDWIGAAGYTFNGLPYPYSSYGGATDLWGETWTYTDINNINFGVAIRPSESGTGGYPLIDGFRITIYYSINETVADSIPMSEVVKSGGVVSDIMTMTQVYVETFADSIGLSEAYFSFKLGWQNLAKNVATFTNAVKNSATFTNLSKTVSSWTNQSKT